MKDGLFAAQMSPTRVVVGERPIVLILIGILGLLLEAGCGPPR